MFLGGASGVDSGRELGENKVSRSGDIKPLNQSGGNMRTIYSESIDDRFTDQAHTSCKAVKEEM